MKNFKKVLTIALACVMLIGLIPSADVSAYIDRKCPSSSCISLGVSMVRDTTGDDCPSCQGRHTVYRYDCQRCGYRGFYCDSCGRQVG